MGYALTSAWTAGETEAANEDFLAWLDHMEASPRPKVAVLADIGSRPGRSGIVSDGMIAEFAAFGCVGTVVGGSVMDIIPMEQLGVPVWASGVVPAYDQLRMSSFGRPVDIGPLRIADGDLLMADRGGAARLAPYSKSADAQFLTAGNLPSYSSGSQAQRTGSGREPRSKPGRP